MQKARPGRSSSGMIYPPRYAPLQLGLQLEPELSLIEQLEVQTRSAAVSSQSSHRAARGRRMRRYPAAEKREVDHPRTVPISHHSVGRMLPLPGYKSIGDIVSSTVSQTRFMSHRNVFVIGLAVSCLKFARVDSREFR